MTTDRPIILDWHQENLDNFKGASNGNRNALLNKNAMASFQLAFDNEQILSPSTVESDYRSAALALGLVENEANATIKSAMAGAKNKPRDTSTSNHKSDSPQPNVSKANLIIEPVYTELEAYAKAHGATESDYTRAGWKLGVFPYGKHKGQPCFLVPHEDGITRARMLNPSECDNTKWLPIKSAGMKGKITPCGYGFRDVMSIVKKHNHKHIILCNGQPSVISAQSHGLPAIAQTDGEGKSLETKFVQRFQQLTKEHKLTVLIAMDGDDAGREGTAKRLEQLQVNGIKCKVVHFGGDDGFDLADFCKLHKSKSMDKLLRLSRYGQKHVSPVVDRDKLAADAHGVLVAPSQNMPTGELLVTPFKSFHELGGFAHILQPGKITMILAPSGGGKTTFMETWSDTWNMRGYDTLWFSPEWTPLSMQFRAIQRYSGISTNDIVSHWLYFAEVERNIPAEYRYGIEVQKDTPKYKLFIETNERVASWPGRLSVLQGQRVTEQVLEDMGKKIWEARREDRRVGAAFFDYAQILNTKNEEDAKNSYEVICNEIKQWSGDMDVHSFIGSQPTKTKGEHSKNTNTPLDKYDSMWVRPDVANLIINPHIIYISDPRDSSKRIKTTDAIANIAKNNEGREGHVKIETNFQYLSWKEC